MRNIVFELNHQKPLFQSSGMDTNKVLMRSFVYYNSHRCPVNRLENTHMHTNLTPAI